MSIQVYNLREVERPGRIGRRYPAGSVTSPAPYVDRDVAMLGNSITPQRLTSLLQARNEGNLQGWVDFANEMRRNNPHLGSQLSIRELSAVETPYVIKSGLEDDPQADKARAACEKLYQRWQTRGLDDWQAQWVAAAYYGRTGHEAIWTVEDGLMTPVELEHIDERRLSLACDYLDPDPWALRLWDQGVAGEPLYGRKLSSYGPDKILAHEPRVLGGLKTAEGLFSTVVWYCVFATWSWRDLMALCEMVGRPPAVAYYNAGGIGASPNAEPGREASKEEREVAKKAVFGLSGSLRAVLPDTVRLELLKYAAGPGEPIQLLAEERANALISKVVNGVANLSDLQPGARAAVESQERTSFTFWRADCRRVARQINTLFAWFVRANPGAFGVDCPVPCAEPQTAPVTDREKVAKGIAGAQAAGVRVPRAFAHRELQIPEPKVINGSEEPVLEPVTPPAPTAPTPGHRQPGEDPPATE